MPVTTWDTNPTWGQPYAPEDTTKKEIWTMGGGGGEVTGGIGGIPQYPKLPTYIPPAYPTLPTYTQTPFDIGRVNLLTQETAAPELARLRTATRQAISAGKRTGTPEAYREAIAGYGTGIANLMPSAQRRGLEQYTATEYNPALEAGRMNYQGQINKLMGDYQAAVSAGQTNQAQKIQELLGKYERDFKSWEYTQKGRDVEAARKEKAGQNLGIGILPWTTSGMGTVKKPFTSYEEDFAKKGKADQMVWDENRGWVMPGEYKTQPKTSSIGWSESNDGGFRDIVSAGREETRPMIKQYSQYGPYQDTYRWGG